MTDAMERIARAWALLTWRHWVWATVLAGLVSIAMALIQFDINNYWTLERVLYRSPWYVLFAYLFLLAIAWVEASRGDAAPSLWQYASAAFGAGASCVVLVALLASYVALPPFTVIDGRRVAAPADVAKVTLRRISVVMSPGLDGAYMGFLATMIYANLRNARRMALSLSRAEIGRSEASRALLAARLAAARSAIDPAQVIARLDAIARLYEEDPHAADARMDELIAALREAIPRLREDAIAPR